MAKVYGIDLGTTYSAIATLDDRGMPEVVENFVDSSPLLASAVYFPENGDPVIGREAKNQSETEPERVIQFVKREIGKPNALSREFNGVPYDPITISSLILKRMKEYAAEQGHEVEDVVITCPAYFGTEERNATRQAGQIAGLNVLQIVNEPTAAALNYCSKVFQENRRIMVYDLGGGTFDITLFNFSVDEDEKFSIEVLGTGGNDRLGGIDWDKRLYDYICEAYADENGLELSDLDSEPELRQKISGQVEDIKRSLSSMMSKSFTINYAGDPTRLEVTREKFEELTRDLVDQTMDFVRKTLQDTALSASDIDMVLLVGGSTRMPMIKAALEAEYAGKIRVEEPDLAVAKGAALAAAIAWNETVRQESKDDKKIAPDLRSQSDNNQSAPQKSREPRELINIIGSLDTAEGGTPFHDILSRSFGPAIFHGDNRRPENYVIDNLLFVGDESPSVVSRVYGTAIDNQPGVDIPIFENMSRDRDNPYVTPCQDSDGNEQYTDPDLKVKYLGEVSFDLPAGTPKGSPIEVTLDYSTSGLTATALNQATGETFHVTISFPNAKSEEAVEEDTRRLAAINTRGQI